MDHGGDRDTAWRRQTLDPRGDIHAVAIDVATF